MDPAEKTDDDLDAPLVDTELLAIKALYFAQGMASVSYFPFLNVWLEGAAGLSRTQIGIIGSTRQLTNLIGSPLWGGISDKYSIHKKVLFTSVLLSAIGRLSLTFFGTSFTIIIATIFFSDFFYSICGPMMDRICLSKLGESRKHEYGKQRLWSTVGWGGFATPIGKLVQFTGNLNWFFFIHAICSSIYLAIIGFCKVDSGDTKKSPPPFWKSLGIIANVRCAVFLSAIVVVGMQNGILGNYVFLHLKQLGASSTLLGLCLVSNTLTEVPFLFFSGQITKAITPEGGILLAAVATFIRMTGYYFLTDPWYTLPLELTHGLTFGLMWGSAVQIAASMAPPHLTTTMQGILSAAHAGFGSMMGAAIGGYLFDKYEATFWLMSCILPTFLFFGYGSYILFEKIRSRSGMGGQSYAMVGMEVLNEDGKSHASPIAEPHSDDEDEALKLNMRASFESRNRARTKSQSMPKENV